MIGGDVTTVADDLIVVHDAPTVHRLDGLTPATEYTVGGHVVSTLPRPPGALVARVATVNDLHFGEIECGRIGDDERGPIRRAQPGETPYPETMNRAAADEIEAIDPDAVVVKGDLTADGTDAEFAAFERCYRDRFGDRLHVVRGNHDGYRGQTRYSGDAWIEVPGLLIGLLDTVRPGASNGRLRREQIDAIDRRAARADRPVLLMGHHHQWIPRRDGRRDPGYFGLDPDASDALDEVCARRSAVIGYAAGHTHRHRVRPMERSGVPSIEVGCVKDFPGTWAEYRVYEGGVMQVVHRISSPAALAWSEPCRTLYADFGIDYGSFALGSLADRCFVFPGRDGGPRTV